MDNGGVRAPSSMTGSAPNRNGGDAAFDPTGLRVLVVDDDPICLKILERMLGKYRYEVTTCSKAVVALSMLRERKDGFDLVLSDVYMPDMDGFKLLEHIGLEMDLPVIMMSADDGKDVVMRGVTHGACDYLIKPVRIEALKNIWQHVVRRKNNERRKDEDEESEDREDSSTLKKPRVVWSVELHQQFVAAVNQLGIEKAVPKKILELMNVPGLTRENVASHLQEYRFYLKRVRVSQHPGGINTPFVGTPEATLGSISSLDGFDFQALAASGQLSQQNLMTLQAGFGRTSSNAGKGISLADQMNLLNSNTQIASSLKVNYGGQQLSSEQVNLLHGLPTNIEPKQLALLHQPIQSVRNMESQAREGNSGFLNLPSTVPRTGSTHGDAIHGHQNSSIMMQMTQHRPQFPLYQSQSQGQTQVDILQQSRPKGQLLNEIVSSHSSGLPSSIAQQIFPNDMASQVLGRSGDVMNGRDAPNDIIFNSQYYLHRMSSSNTICSDCTPKCRCGAGEMKLYTSRTQLNSNRKFWKCPNWNDENDCGAFLWKDEAAHWQLAEANSMTCERENWREEKSNLIAVVEKLESSLCVFFEVKKIRNAYLRKIYHAIIVACCIIIFVFLFS